jgi:hypothetical protein
MGAIELCADCELLLGTIVQTAMAEYLPQLEVQCGRIWRQTDRDFKLRLGCLYISPGLKRAA